MRNNRCCNDDQTQDFPILPDIKTWVTLEIKDWMKVLMVGKKKYFKIISNATRHMSGSPRTGAACLVSAGSEGVKTALPTAVSS